MKRRNTGFTLVEVLVVIAIISLLVAILLGAIVYVRSRARLLECGNNARQIVMGSRNYASRVRPYKLFPPGPPQAYPAPPALSYFTVAGANQAGGNLGQMVVWDGNAPAGLQVRNHGWLYQQKDVANETAFYCPDQAGEYFSNNTVSGFFDSNNTSRWGVTGAGAGVIRTSYAMRSSLHNQQGNSLTTRPISTESESSRDAAVADVFTVSPTIGDNRLAHGNNRYTVAAADGSVKVYEDPGKLIEARNFTSLPAGVGDFATYEDPLTGAWVLFGQQ